MSMRRKQLLPSLTFEPKTEPVFVSPPWNLDKQTTITVDDKNIVVHTDELVKICDLGHGAYGFVEKMQHKPSNTTMAVKRIIVPLNNKSLELKRLETELDVCGRVSSCPYIIHFYSATLYMGDVWICMEVMDMSLDKFYLKTYKNNKTITEGILRTVAFSTVSALHFLYSNLRVIHRDVKPSNILINRKGEVKICDFGVSRYLDDSGAMSVDAGCQRYMAPERIDPRNNRGQYDIRSDVWSLGITLIELATGKYPYNGWDNIFQQMDQVLKDNSPRLPRGQFSSVFEDFTNQCLKKDYKERPNYDTLLAHKLCQECSQTKTIDASLVQEILDLPEDVY